MIPRIIHFIWLGSPVGIDDMRRIVQWERSHPDYEVRLWTDAELQRHPAAFLSRRFAGQWPGPVYTADVLRAEILYKLGGFYLDTDIVQVRNLDCIRELAPAIFCRSREPGRRTRSYIENCFAASVPGHPIVGEWLHRALAGDPLQRPIVATGPQPLQRAVKVWKNRRGYPGHHLLTHRVFCPFHFKQRAEIDRHDLAQLPWPTVGVHLWGTRYCHTSKWSKAARRQRRIKQARRRRRQRRR